MRGTHASGAPPNPTNEEAPAAANDEGLRKIKERSDSSTAKRVSKRPPRPVASAPIFENIPDELRAVPRWICWRHAWHAQRAKWIKLPVCADDPSKPAGSSNPSTWTDFETARATYELIGGVDGVGFVFNGDGLIGGDLDKCIDGETGELSDVAREAMKRIPAYWETSPSGRGLHFIARAEIPKAFKDDAKGIELYKTGRYFTITGRNASGSISDVELQWFIEAHFPQPIADLPAKVERDGDFFGRVNDAAMERLGEWVPKLFPKARPYQGGYRVTSAQLGRDREEDLSIVPQGIVDFGEHDMGDDHEGKRTPIDVVMEWYAPQIAGGDVHKTPDAKGAALWLCEQMDVDPVELGWRESSVAGLPFDCDEDGLIYATKRNLQIALSAPDFIGAQIGFDTFRDEIMLARKRTDEWRPFSDADYERLGIALEDAGFRTVSHDGLRRAVQLAADESKFDSAVLWLRSIEWDGTERVERFFADYFGAQASEYTRAVSLYLWTALAARVLEPGCKADMVPVLIGSQGVGKTSGVAAMVVSPDHFIEVDLGERDADLARKMRGRLIGEIAELRGLQSRELESIKTFITRTHEKWVPKYKEFEVTFPRRLVFIGTTNADEFLSDETGNRRWLPVKVTRVDVSRIARDRLQLWAEAAVLWSVGGTAFEAAERLGRAVHAEHAVSDPWQEAICRWLDDVEPFDEPSARTRADRPFSVSDVLVGALGFEPQRITMREQHRVGRILRGLGFAKRDERIGQRVAKLWRKSDVASRSLSGQVRGNAERL